MRGAFKSLTWMSLLVAASAMPTFGQQGPPKGRQASIDFALQQGMDDNALGADQRGYFLEATPRMFFRQEHAHGFWAVDYRPTFRRFYNVPIADRVDHSLFVAGGVKFRRRWSADFRSRLAHSSNPFLRTQDLATGDGTEGSVILGPNLSFVAAVHPVTILDSSLSVHYQLGRHSRLTFGADYFRDDENEERLVSNDARGLRVQYEERYARNRTVSVLYSLRLFRTAAAGTRVRTHSLLVTYSYDWKPGTRLDFFGGPQFSLVRARPTLNLNFLFFQLPVLVSIREPVTGFTAGAAFGQRLNDRSSLVFSFSHRISDGGGITSTVVQNMASSALRWRLNPHFSGFLSVDLSKSYSLGHLGLSSPLQAWGISTGIDFALTRHTSLTATYGLSHYGRAPESLRPLVMHNRFVLGLRYSSGTFPIGR